MRVCEAGRHTLVYGDDGISILTYRGPVSAAEMKTILDSEDLANVPDVVLVICDMRQLGPIDPEARRMGARSPKPAKRYFTAYIGATFALRVVVDLWTRATNAFHGKKYSVDFFDDIEAARVWLLARRAAFEGTKK